MTLCYLCEKDGADTTEHVVPRCLYPGKLPSDVITLPAHGACNKLTSKDEEAFRNHISVAIPRDSFGFPLWEKTWKAIHRPEAQGMQRVFYTDMLSLPVLDADGEVRASPVTARLGQDRANRVLAKIVRGLFTWKTGELLPSDAIGWRFGQAENGLGQVRLPNAFMVHNLLDVRWGRAADEPLGTTWILGFHGVAWFWTSTVPKEKVMQGVDCEAMQMTWPGP